MFKNISAPAIVLYCTIPLRFVIEWMPILGMPRISTALVLVQYLAMLYCLVKCVSNPSLSRLPKLTKNVILFFLFYSGYLIYDIILNPQLPRLDMSHTPDSNSTIIQSIISYSLVFYFVNLYNTKVNFIKWAQASCALLSFLLIVYCIKVDIGLYALSRIMYTPEQGAEFNFADYGMFDSLRLGWFCGITYICSLFCKNSWSNTASVNKCIFWGMTILSVGICMATTQRGPIIFILTTTLFYYYAKGYFQKKYWGYLFFLLITIILFNNVITDLLYRVSPELMTRFADITEGGSGRYGSEDSAYSLAFKEFMLSPIWGHYFRYTTTTGYFYGLYPHNIILESLMTMGLIGTIPFVVLLYRCVKNSYYAIKEDSPIAIFGLIFIYIFSTLMTSTSMVFLGNFWIPMALISSYIPNNLNKNS